MTSARCIAVVVAGLAVLTSPGIAFAAGDARHDLLLQQQHDTLSLQMRQGMAVSRAQLSAADRRRVDQLQFEQRLQQQQLEMQQLQRESLARHDGRSFPDASTQAELHVRRQIFQQERQLQIQQFDVDRQRLLQSLTPRPLQPAPVPGQLTLP